MSASDYLVSIGLEIHVQLKTNSKIWCSCPNQSDAPPNRLTCPICLGYPGVMPVLNREAVRLICMTGMMLNGKVQPFSKFDRKNYFYPDQAKNYQISQYDFPFVQGGHIEVMVGETLKTFSLTRIHLEEDVAKSVHAGKNSLIDFNRAGTPLMEIVTEPDFSHPDEVMAFLQALRKILVNADISDANLEAGNLRCDVNTSIRPVGQAELGVKTEIKNMNTFKGIHRALSYEIKRQVDELSKGGTIVQETRRWDDDAGLTSSMRTKEYAHDYRYFPEPDLVPVELTQEVIENWRAQLPELPAARKERFMKEYDLPEYDAGILATDKATAEYFETAVSGVSSPKMISNWVMTEVLREVSESGISISDLKVTPDMLQELVGLVENSTINANTGKELFVEMSSTGQSPSQLVKDKNLAQVSDESALSSWIAEAISSNPKSVEDFKAGKKAAAQFLMGQVMRMSKGKANPKLVMPALLKALEELL